MEVYHHGILGQKWGVMHGPPYPLDAKESKAIVKRAEKSEPKQKSSGGSNDDMKSLRKINQSGFVKNSDGSYTIPKDHKFYRVGNSSIDVNKQGGLYMSDASTNDVHRYVKSLGPTFLGKIFGTAAYNVQGLSAKEDMKMASDAQHNKLVLDILKDNKDLYNTWKDSAYSVAATGSFEKEYSQKDIAKFAKNPNSKEAKAIGYSVSSFYGDPNYSDETKQFYSAFRKAGFDAIPDTHDKMSGTSESAMIVLNPSKIEQVTNTYITKDVMKNGKRIAKEAGKIPLDEALKF